MVDRGYWVRAVREAWERRPIVWLAGVRRIGKTTLARQIEGDRFFNCDLPSVRRECADPESFLARVADGGSGTTVILDEVHRLEDPSLLLKIADDEHPGLRILATGSSTLLASHRFSDALTGRKVSLLLPGVLWRECRGAFGGIDYHRRLLHGGFPDQLLAKRPDPHFFEEWIDSYFARDLQELYGLRDRGGYRRLVECLACQSGGALTISDVASQVGLSRPSVYSYLDALEDSHVCFRLPPYHRGGSQEVVRRPRCYLFDTGLIAHVRGWRDLGDGRDGLLWEHLILDHLRTRYPDRALHHWRTRGGDEIDFVVERGGDAVDAIEAKLEPQRWRAGDALGAFRSRYPHGRNLVVGPWVERPSRFRHGDLEIEVVGVDGL